MVPPADHWDEEDLVDIYGSGMDEDNDGFVCMCLYVLHSLCPHDSLMAALAPTASSYINMCGSICPCNENHCNCSKCVHQHEEFKNLWILDSGASMHFTPRRDAFTSYCKFSKEECLPVQMAASTIFMEGKGTIRLRWIDDRQRSHDIELHDVGHISNSGVNLVSLGHLLQAGAKVKGETNTITVMYGDSDILVPFTTGSLGRNMYTLKASPIHSHALGTIDYETVHHCLGHPSKEVAKQAKQHTSGLPDFTIPNDSTVCPGCAKGKQPQCSFPLTSVHAKCAF